jgi:[acyl-carrier-protein] S-malonyltransferase
MKVAWLFPGQGAQRVGMGRDLFESYTTAREAFEQADSAMAGALKKLCFDGPEDELTLTSNLQPALVATSIATVAALQEHYPNLPLPDFAAGHSLGEYSALVAAGVLRLADAIAVVRERGEAMQAAVPPGNGAMLAVLGGNEAQVRALCTEVANGDVLAPANFNCPGQIVIAGDAVAVGRARGQLKIHGLKGIPLKVSAPFHCPLMRPATERMTDVLHSVELGPYQFPVFANVDASPNRDSAATVDLLIRQIEGAVRFQEIVEAMAREGVTHALEIGPGKVLAGLVKKTSPEIQVLGVGDVAGVAAVGQFLGLA